MTRWLNLLLSRLFPRGDAVMQNAANAMVLTAIIWFVLSRPASQPLGEVVIVIAALSLFFLVNLANSDLVGWLGAPRTTSLSLAIGTACFFVANWYGLGPGLSFLPFLLFMLSAQAVVDFGVRNGVLYAIIMLIGWSLMTRLLGASWPSIFTNAVSISLGMLFSCTLAVVLLQMAEQKQRAEALAADLRAARERERDLAAAEERLRLAREIHDGLGHHLTALAMQLQVAERFIERDQARAAAAIRTSRQVAQAALDEVRQSVASMRRSPLDGRTIDQALAGLVREFAERTELAAQFAHHGNLPNLTPAAAMTLYRVAQEGLTNAQKHAIGAAVTVDLSAEADGVALAIANAPGRAAPQQGGGFGLAGLRERVDQLGGHFAALPTAEGGFRLQVRLPYHEGVLA